MLMPGRGVDMGDGWETRRRREPGNDWAIVALAHPGVIHAIEVDTAHFKGNFPMAVRCRPHESRAARMNRLSPRPCSGRCCCRNRSCRRTIFIDSKSEVAALGPVTHVRFNMFPDGGVSRLRLFGAIE